MTAYDKEDETTVLVLVHEAIDHTDQDHTMLSTNQMRHAGVDVCDTHPKFLMGGEMAYSESVFRGMNFHLKWRMGLLL